MVHQPNDHESPIDTTLRALADEHRRLVIQYLMEAPEGTASFDELKEHITTHSSGEDTPRDVAIRLHHVNLPLLADADVVEYDARSETARYRGDPFVEDVLSSIEATSDDPSNH